MLAIIHLFWASYRHNKLYVGLVFFAMLTATSGLCAVLVVNSAAQHSYASVTQPFLPQVEHRIIAKPGYSLNKQDFAELSRLGINQLVPVLRTTQSVLHPVTGNTFSVTLVGIDAFAVMAVARQGSASAADISNQLNQLWQTPYASILHPDFAKQLNLSNQQALKLAHGRALPRLATTKIEGLARELIVDIGQLQFALEQESLSELLVVTGSDPELAQRLLKILPSHLKLERLNTEQQTAQLTDSFQLNLLAMACLMFVVCLFVVMNALHLLLLKRWQNFKIARQLGVSTQQLYLAQSLELLLLSALIAPFGALLGVMLAQVASPVVAQTLESLFDVRVGFTGVSYSVLILQNFVACCIGAFAAAILPLYRLNTQLSSPKLSTTSRNREKNGLIVAVVLLVLAGLQGFYSNNLLMSFIAIALFVLAGCSALIYLIPQLLRRLKNIVPQKWPLLRWMVADGIRLSLKSKIAFCAFFIAVTSNLGMNFMIDSFRQATQQWLQQRLVGDLYVSTAAPAKFEQWLSQQSGILQVVARKSIDANLVHDDFASAKVQLRSYPSDALYRDALSFAEVQSSPWGSFTQNEGVFINQQLAIKFGLEVGDNVFYQIPEYPVMSSPVLGIYYDYGNQHGQALLPADNPSLTDAKRSSFTLHFDSTLEQNTFLQALQSSSLSSQVTVRNTEEILALSMQTFDRTFVITDGLNLITLLVAAFSLATSVLMIDLDNRPQRALLRAMGVGQYHLTGLSLIQYFWLIVLVCVVAVPFAIGLTWLLINLVNIQAFSWSYPMLIAPQKLIAVSAVSSLLVLIIVALPLYNVSRRKLIEDIKCLHF